MNGKRRGQNGRFLVAALAVGVLIAVSAVKVRAVLFEFTDDPGYNTNAPAGELANSGWQYEGFWSTSVELSTNLYPVGEFLGTPIAPQFFVTAAHVLGATNDVFIFNGVTYHPVAQFTTLDSDLSIWQVAETFPYYAPLYTGSDETNQPVVVFGRGTDRGAPVIVDGLTGGWTWGATNWVERWGQSTVSAVTNCGWGVGDLLRCEFDGDTGSNECGLSYGDSGGGVFIESTNGVWELAGVNYSADGPFSFTAEGSNAFSAFMVDAGGLYEEVERGTWELRSSMSPIPSAFYCTRISANLEWIRSVINYDLGPDLQVGSVQRTASGFQISISTGIGRVYYIQSATNAMDGPWSTIISNIPGTGGIVTLTDTNAVSSQPRYYRVGLSQ
ncbi:MAG TPA: hypothetical protein VMV72_04195 [Verrucomicrobiae bacterium]|nr:hypothetical protein [Verrucomicrobiae bacterium]